MFSFLNQIAEELEDAFGQKAKNDEDFVINLRRIKLKN